MNIILSYSSSTLSLGSPIQTIIYYKCDNYPAHRPCRSEQLPEQKSRCVNIPLQVKAWRQVLTHHPDPAFQRYIIESLSEEFCIGFDCRQPLQSARKNMPSAVQHHTVVAEYVANEKALRHFHGPMPKPQPNIHINWFGSVIPKGHTPGKWRLITVLSFPPGRSVNDGIDLALCSLSYVPVDTVATAVAAFSTGALMAKVDIQ